MHGSQTQNRISLMIFSESGCVWVIPAQRCEGLDKLPGMDESGMNGYGRPTCSKQRSIGTPRSQLKVG